MSLTTALSSLQTQLDDLLFILQEEQHDVMASLPRCLMCNQPYGHLKKSNTQLAKIKARCGCVGVGNDCAYNMVATINKQEFVANGCRLRPEQFSCFKCRRQNK